MMIKQLEYDQYNTDVDNNLVSSLRQLQIYTDDSKEKECLLRRSAIIVRGTVTDLVESD